MAKNDGRIEKGQRIASAISARAWNRAQDAADIVLGARPGIAAGEASEPLSRNWLYARAATAINAREWCLVKPADLPAPATNPPINWASLTSSEQSSAKRTFQSSPVIGDVHSARTGYPSSLQAWQASHVVLSLEPAQVGDVIRVQVAGLAYAEINLRHRYHPSARLTPLHTYQTGFGTSVQLESTMCGPLKIIWLDTRNYNGPTTSSTSNSCPAIVSL